MNKLSLRTKGLLFVVLITIIPLLLAGFVNYVSVKNSMLDSVIEQAGSRQGSYASNLSAWMAIRRAEVLVMSRMEVVTGGSDADKLAYFNKEIVRLGFIYQAIGYIDREGRALRTDGPPVDLSSEPYLRDVKEGRVVVTDPFRPAFSDGSQTLILVPVYGQGNEWQGIVYASVALSRLEPFFDVKLNRKSEIRVFNDSGQTVYLPDMAENGFRDANGKEEGWQAVTRELLGKEGGIERVNAGGKEQIIFYSKVDNTPWILAIRMPLDQLLNELRPVYLGIFISIGLAEVLIIVFFLLYFEKIVSRLRGILSVTEEAAAGRFEAEHLAELPGDEIGQLARSVNGMTVHLKEMFERLEAIVNQNQYAFIVLNEEYRIVYMNATAEEMLGYRLEELAQHATPLVFMDTDELREEAERLTGRLGRDVQPGLEVFKELRQERFAYEREWTFIAKDGRRIPVLLSSNGLRDRNGRFTGVVDIAYDVSERKQVEMSRNRLLDIVESAKDLIASIDRKGKIFYINGAGREMLGVGRDEHRPVAQFFERPVYARIIAGAKQAYRHGYWEGETEFHTLSGETVHVSMVVVAHREEGTGETYFSCIARDISEQRHVQEELVRAKLEAEEANKAKSSFLALMSHEIRTPLNGIIGLSQLVRKTGMSESQKDYMDKINTSSETLLRLINDILDFSKIEAGKIDVERLPFQPEELLTRLTDQLSVFMGGKENFEFIVVTPPELPDRISGDPLRLEQILLNLCMNAIKFTSVGRVTLKLEIRERTRDSVAIRFAVADTGIGMTREQVAKLFKPFTQADGSTTRKYGGTGLGLYISKHFVELMGGRLKVDSEAGSGSRFHFQLQFPVVEATSMPAMLRPELSGQPVWVVENDAVMCRLLCEWLESFGLVAVVFHSWRGVMDRLRRVGAGAMPKLVLLDMEMEDMYGMETWLDLSKEAREDGVLTAVMTTSYGRDEMLQLPEPERPMSLLTKPVTRHSLFRAISGLLERTEQEKERPFRIEAAAAAEQPGSIRILLAEDNKINQLVSIESLKGYGFFVGVAENGREALAKLEEEEWDLVLMDIHMPEMDGEEAVRLIRANPRLKRLPVVALTANGLKADHERYVRLGMNDVITKPVDARQLYETVVRWLGKEPPLPSASGAWSAAAASQPLTLPEERKGPAAELPFISGIDRNALLARVGDKPRIARHMLERFLQDYAGFCEALTGLLEEGDQAAAKRKTHTLKGAAGNLSAFRVLETVTALDSLLRSSQAGRGEWVPLVERLRLELSDLLQSLEKAMNS